MPFEKMVDRESADSGTAYDDLQGVEEGWKESLFSKECAWHRYIRSTRCDTETNEAMKPPEYIYMSHSEVMRIRI